jgi:hypothetical protein
MVNLEVSPRTANYRHSFRNNLILIAFAGMATQICSAQATRTWVSGIGDDANPCSRTAPCKTFAGAISKTAVGGQINAIDPGGFGGVTITKSIQIDGSPVLAGVLVSGTNAITINAGANDVVVLRNLVIDGMGTGLKGIQFLNGKKLVIENCTISGFTVRGISIESNVNNAMALVSNTLVKDGTNNGIIVNPPSSITNCLMVDHSRIVHNTNAGIGSTAGGIVQIMDSVIHGNGGLGVVNNAATFDIMRTIITNATKGIQSLGSATTRLSDVSITGNQTGLDTQGGTVYSYGNNQIRGNVNGNGPVTLMQLQ